MGVYIPNITEEQYRQAMFGCKCKTLHEDGTFTIEPRDGFSFKIPNPIEIKAPHGRLLDENELLERCAIRGITKCIDAVIEAER